ncbi:MAG TPA: hypothetical protein VFS23_25170 [Vicinamibacterales bacterium]|nr:hypothetical protein [Vicinamibacterales bacterium]
MNRLTGLVVRLYPRWWRQRYGAELQALMEDSGETWWDVLDLAKGAFAMRVSTVGNVDWVRGAAVGGFVSMGVWALVFFTMPTRFTSISTITIQSSDEATPSPPAAVALGAFNDNNLGSLVEKHGLYSSDRGRGTGVLRRFREDIAVTLMAPDAEARGGQVPDAQTPEPFRDQGRLQISFSYPDGPKSQAVALELARLVIEENLHQPPMARYRVTGVPDHVAADSNATMALGWALGAGALAALGVAVLRGRAVLPPVNK